MTTEAGYNTSFNLGQLPSLGVSVAVRSRNQGRPACKKQTLLPSETSQGGGPRLPLLEPMGRNGVPGSTSPGHLGGSSYVEWESHSF